MLKRNHSKNSGVADLIIILGLSLAAIVLPLLTRSVGKRQIFNQLAGGSAPSCSSGTTDEGTHGECCGCKKAKEVRKCKRSDGTYEWKISDCSHDAPNCNNGCPAEPTKTPSQPTSPPSGGGCSNCKKDVTNACNSACCCGSGDCPSGQSCDIPNGHCQSGKSCNPSGSGYHKECRDKQCVEVPGSGSDRCSSNSQCQQATSTPTPIRTPTPVPGSEQYPAGCCYNSSLGNYRSCPSGQLCNIPNGACGNGGKSCNPSSDGGFHKDWVSGQCVYVPGGGPDKCGLPTPTPRPTSSPTPRPTAAPVPSIPDCFCVVGLFFGPGCASGGISEGSPCIEPTPVPSVPGCFCVDGKFWGTGCASGGISVGSPCNEDTYIPVPQPTATPVKCQPNKITCVNTSTAALCDENGYKWTYITCPSGYTCPSGGKGCVAKSSPTLKPTATPTKKPTPTPTLKPTATPTSKPTPTPVCYTKNYCDISCFTECSKSGSCWVCPGLPPTPTPASQNRKYCGEYPNGTILCDGWIESRYQFCKDDGEWETRYCFSGYSCRDGRCQEPLPTPTPAFTCCQLWEKCQGKTNGGCGWGRTYCESCWGAPVPTSIPTPTPINFCGQGGEHLEGNLWCDGTRIKKCENGTIKGVTDCPYGCSNSKCNTSPGMCGELLNGAVVCAGERTNVYYVCQNGETVAYTCPSGTTCRDGRCQEPLPTPTKTSTGMCGELLNGTVICTGEPNIYSVCENGKMVDRKCPSGTTCRDGRCQEPLPTPTPALVCTCDNGFWQGEGCDEWTKGKACVESVKVTPFIVTPYLTPIPANICFGKCKFLKCSKGKNEVDVGRKNCPTTYTCCEPALLTATPIPQPTSIPTPIPTKTPTLAPVNLSCGKHPHDTSWCQGNSVKWCNKGKTKTDKDCPHPYGCVNGECSSHPCCDFLQTCQGKKYGGCGLGRTYCDSCGGVLDPFLKEIFPPIK